MDIKEEPGESLQVSNADVSDMKIKVEPGLETNSGLESVSLELSHMPEAKSVMAHLSVKMKAPDLCTDLIPELPDTGTELGLRDMTPVVIKSEPEDHTDVPDSDIQDIGSSERCLEPQPVLLVENTAHSGCFLSGPGTSADYAVMSLVTEQTTQMIAVTFEAGDGTYSDCTFNAVVENIAFVATGEGRNPSVLEKEVELSDDDVIIVETGKNDQSTASCCTEPEAHSKAMEMESEESETNEGSGSSDEFDTTPDEAVAVPQQKFECQYCGKAFLTKFYLGKHERLHNGEKPYKCKQCCRYFSAMWQLMDHMHTHAKALDYICKHCGETFKNGSYWRQHERAHANKKLHCHLCGRVFIKKLYLLYHKKSFHGLDVKNKPLKCSSCPKTFHRIQDLDLHRAVHLKYFECDQCGEKFNHKHLMSRHKNKVHLSI